MADARVDILLALKSKLEGAEQAIGFLGSFARNLTIAGVAYSAFRTAVSSGQLAGEIKNLSAEANMTTDAFQALKLGAMGFGVAQGDIVRSAVTLRKNLEDAVKDGASPLNEQLRRLGLTAAGLQALAPERQFEVLGRAIAGAADKEAAFRAGLELLGAKQAPKLLEFLRTLGAEGFDTIAKSAKALTLTPAELDTLDKAANAWQRIGEAMKIAGARATLAVLGPGGGNGLVKAGEDPRALETMIRIQRERVEAYEKRGMGNDPRAVEYRRSLEILETRLKEKQAVEETAKATATVAAKETEAKMAAAELAATLRGLAAQDRELRQGLEAFNQKTLNSAIDAVRKREAADQEAAEKEAEKYKALANPMREYELQLRKILELRQKTLLTEQESAAATKAVTQAMLERAGEIGNHTRRLSELQEQRGLVEKNPFTSVEARRSELARILSEENVELDKQIALLRAKENLTPSQSRQLDDLVRRRTDNQFDPSGFTFGQQVAADVMSWSNSFGTQAQQASGVITNTIGRAVDGVGAGIRGWLRGTNDWLRVLEEIGVGALADVIVMLFRIGAQQVINATIGKTLQATSAATTLATTAATAAGISALMIGPATLATIATLGEAALAAPLQIGLAKAMALPMGMFYEGGHTGAGGIVHANEWVAPAWMVSDPVFGGVIDSLESARTGAGVAPPIAPAAAGGGKPERLVLVVDSMNKARELERDPEWNTVIARSVRANRGEILGA